MPPLTAGTLLGLAALHGAWGLGSTAPFASHDELADAVLGRRAHPGQPTGSVPIASAAACFAVAGALSVASSLVADRPRWPGRVRRLGLAVLSGTLLVRGVLGLAGRTDALVPGSTSLRFRRNDRRLFAPTCLLLAAGSLRALRRASLTEGMLRPGPVTTAGN